MRSMTSDTALDDEQHRKQTMEKYKQFSLDACNRRCKYELTKEGHHLDFERQFLGLLYPIIRDGDINKVKEADKELEWMIKKFNWFEKSCGF